MNRRKLIGLVASVLVAGLGTLVLLKYANSSKGTTPAAVAEPTVPVLKVQRLIAKGTPAELIGDAVIVEQVPASQKMNDAADNVSLLTGLVASTDLLPNEQIVKARFIPASEQKKQEAGSGAGLIGVWITLEPVRALNGQIQVNDTVAVFGSFTGTPALYPTPPNEQVVSPSTHLSLHKVPVLDVIGNVPPVVPTAEGQAPAAPVAPAATVQIKLGVTAAEAERLVFAASFGQIWLGSEDLDVSEEGTKVVDRSNVYTPTPRPSISVPPNPNPLAGQPAQDATNVAATVTPAAAPTTVAAPAKPAAPAPAKPAATPAKPAVVPPPAPAAPAPAAPAPTVAKKP